MVIGVWCKLALTKMNITINVPIIYNNNDVII